MFFPFQQKEETWRRGRHFSFLILLLFLMGGRHFLMSSVHQVPDLRKGGRHFWWCLPFLEELLVGRGRRHYFYVFQLFKKVSSSLWKREETLQFLRSSHSSKRRRLEEWEEHFNLMFFPFQQKGGDLKNGKTLWIRCSSHSSKKEETWRMGRHLNMMIFPFYQKGRDL